MDYLTIQRHVSECREFVSRKLSAIRAFAPPEGGIVICLKASGFHSHLHLNLDSFMQGFYFAEPDGEIGVENAFIRSLDKFLQDAVLKNIRLFGNDDVKTFDRIVELTISCAPGFFGDRTDIRLILELTGRVSNILICNSEGRVIDMYRRSLNNHCGHDYSTPPGLKNTLDPLIADDLIVSRILSDDPKTWSSRIGGLSPHLAAELTYRLKLQPENDPVGILKELLSETLSSNSAGVYFENEKVYAICAAELHHLSGDLSKKEFPSVNAALAWLHNNIYIRKILEMKRSIKSAGILREISRVEKLMGKHLDQAAEYVRAEHLKRMGELILNNIRSIPPRATEINLRDWETDMPLSIALNPGLSPAKNAERYFKKYKKAQRGISEVEKRISLLESELKWLKEKLWLAENAQSLFDLTEEFRDLKPARAVAGKSASKPQSRKKILKPVLTLNNCDFYVGKNAAQNEFITFRIARRGDLWFHALDVPGSHVIARKTEGEFDESDRLNGAILAAYFSFAKNGGKTPVDVTDAAFVKRVPGGGPGRVSYSKQKTLYVNPGNAADLFETSALQSYRNDDERIE